MAIFVRAKRATCPLDDIAKARLCTSNTAAHCSVDLSVLVHDFLDPAAECGGGGGGEFATDDEEDAGDISSGAAIADTIRHLLCSPAKDDVFRARLLAAASDAAEALSVLRTTGRSAYSRAVMARLRSAGYDAGVCRSKWDASGSGLTAGCYEYIDVVNVSARGGSISQTVRYVVDVDFAAEFEIARAAPAYGRVLSALPRVVAVTAEDLRRAVKAAAEAVGRSFRSQGLSVPPWRKSRYMVAKWLGPYRRTVSVIPVIAGGGGGDEIQCRAVGFAPPQPQGVGVRVAPRMR